MRVDMQMMHSSSCLASLSALLCAPVFRGLVLHA